MVLEIFYESMFYEMELIVESKDAGETRTQSYGARSNVDVSQYKGSKRVWAAMERDLRHPALGPVARWFDSNIPQDLRDRCGETVS